MTGANPLDHLPTAHLGHDQIRQHQIDGALPLLDNPESLAPVPGLDHGVPMPLEQPSRGRADRGLVLDQEKGLVPGG